MRDTLKTADYWPERLLLLDEDKEFFHDLCEQNPYPSEKNENGYYALTDTYFETALAKYSAGDSLDDVSRIALTSVCDVFPKLVEMYPPGTEFFTTRPGYSAVHRQIAVLVLCKASVKQISAYFAAFDKFDLEKDNYGGYDKIWACYRNYFQIPLKEQPAQVHWPKAFSNLWLAIDPEEPDFARPHMIKKFLEVWYKEMSSQMAAETDRPGTEQFPNSYVGYWCIEAAAAVVMMDIDDSSFRDHPHYPKDWADWARQKRR